jgi:hypothetical protein
MHTQCPELLLTTAHVAYFKKLIAHQNRLCSEVKLCYDQTGVTMHGTSATDSVLLTICIGKIFFKNYDCQSSRVVRINIYHLYKIIKKVTSFMYHTIHIRIYPNETQDAYNWMHLWFETENRMDKYHTRVYSITNNEPVLSRESLHNASPSNTVQMEMNATQFLDALHKFDAEMFQTVTFTVKGVYKKNTTGQSDTYRIGVEADKSTVVVRGRNDSITGNVHMRASSLTGHPTRVNIKNHRYSLELLHKSLAFYKLSPSTTCTVQFFPHFKLLCLVFHLPHDVFVEVLLPHIPNTYGEDTACSSASDGE